MTRHFCHSLADGYVEAARSAGQELEAVDIGLLDVAFLRSMEEWRYQAPPTNMAAALKGFLEQVMRPGFAVPLEGPSLRAGLLAGRSARVVVTMGMPAFVYRW